jgi:hypothetical protein
MLFTNRLNRVRPRSAPSRRRPPTHRQPALPGRSFQPRLEQLEDRTLLSTLTVTSPADSGDGSLRAVIAAAQNGDQIVFDTSLHGQTITLTSGELAITKDLDIEGPGADQLAISGNRADRIFDISGGATVTIAGLTITDGFTVGSPGQGGGILNDGSQLTVANDVLSHNEALGLAGQTGRGGAIGNISNATLTVSGCLFSQNQAMGGDSASGSGGAIAAPSGTTLTLTIRHSLFLENQAIGSNASLGGAITHVTGSATVIDSTFIGNQAIAGDGPSSNSFARGGAIFNGFGATVTTLTVVNSTFTGNRAVAGSGGSGAALQSTAAGGAIFNPPPAVLTVAGSTFAANQAIGGSNAIGHTSDGLGTSTGSAWGGALVNGALATVTDTTFEDNEALGGSGNTDDDGGFSVVGTAFGGAIYSHPASTTGDPAILIGHNINLRGNRAIGSNGNVAGTLVGQGIGGGLLVAGDHVEVSGSSPGIRVTITNSTIADNLAIGGQGAEGSDGRAAWGGGIARGHRRSLRQHRERQPGDWRRRRCGR